MTVCTNLKQEP